MLAPLDLTGYACVSDADCVGDVVLHCDTAVGKCTQGSTSASGGAGGAGGCSPGFATEAFEKLWATPNAIAWTWAPLGEPDAFNRYELVLESESDGERTYSATENPELGKYKLSDTGGPDIVAFTITGDLKPATSYVGRLRAYDAGDCAHTSAPVTVMTPEDRGTVVQIFDGSSDSCPPTCPDCTFTADCSTAPEPAQGCIRFERSCDSAASTCWEHLKCTPTDGVLPTTFNAVAFDQAYLQIDLRVATSVSSDWSQIWLRAGSPACEYAFQKITFPTDRRYTLQIPLQQLIAIGCSPSVPLTYDALVAGPVTQLDVGANWLGAPAIGEIFELAIKK